MYQLLILSCVLVFCQGDSLLADALGQFGLINVLYLKADKNLDGTITETELDDVFKGLDGNGDGTITAAEFVPSWMLITEFSRELANAYFYLADLNADGVINQKDLSVLYDRFDYDDNGKVSAQEFNHKWQDIYKESSFAVLFERADEDKNEHLSHVEFVKLFASFDSNNDHAVTVDEFHTNWMKEHFGTRAHADQLFQYLDNNRDNKLTSGDMTHLFAMYDANHDGHVDLSELARIALLVGRQ